MSARLVASREQTEQLLRKDKIRHMELRVLQYFLAVAREQSIIRAAESLHLSQPTLSTRIKAMEEELGKQLLIRGTKGSYSTPNALNTASSALL